MKTVFVVLGLVFVLAGCGTPYQEWVYYHDKWMTKQQYDRVIAEERRLTLTVSIRVVASDVS